MDEFTLGQMVTITGSPMTGFFGVVIYLDEANSRYRVRLNGTQQLYYAAEDLKPYAG